MRLNENLFKFNEMKYLDDYKRNLNFSYIQSLILISAYVAGNNKEAFDTKMFLKELSKSRHHHGHESKKSVA